MTPRQARRTDGAGRRASEAGARRSLIRHGLPEQSKEQWRETYERTCYDELPWFDPGGSRSVQLAVRTGFLPRGTKVVDLGCGAGSNVLYLARRGYRTFGIDLSPGAVAAARARAERAHLTVTVAEGDALDLPFANGSFDGAVDHGCFHTLPIPRRPDYADEVHRILKPGGRFVLAWVGREHTTGFGPPHRPSLNEVTSVFESRFQFARTGFQPESDKTGPASYFAFLLRRERPQPPPR